MLRLTAVSEVEEEAMRQGHSTEVLRRGTNAAAACAAARPGEFVGVHGAEHEAVLGVDRCPLEFLSIPGTRAS
jgi:hypothetical protein